MPPVPPRLVATDLDGTLLDAEGRVTPRTREVIEALDQKGVPVVFVTGRPMRWMETLWDAVGGHGLAICSNGGIVYDVPTHQVRQARPIPREVLLEVGRTLRSEVPGTTFAVESTTGFALEDDFVNHHDDRQVPTVRRGRLEQIADDNVVKLLARHRTLGAQEFWDVVEHAVGSQVTTTWSSVGTLVEMSAAGVTKATTLADLCVELGVVSADVVAFGDMPNDLPLLKWAGTSYAMGNAHPTVIAQAQHTAPRHDEDGVALTLAEIFKL